MNTQTPQSSDNPALAPADVCAQAAKKEFDGFREAARASGLVARWRGDWMMYYSRDEGRAGWADNCYPEGDEGEKVRMRVNLLRALIRHLLTMTIAQRPVVDPKAVNSDHASMQQVEIGRAVADHYLHTEKLYKRVDLGVEFGLVEGAAFLHGKWNKSAGGIYAAPPDPNGVPMADGQAPPMPQARGDVEVGVLTPMDVGMDLRASDWDAIRKSHLIVREWLNKWEVAAEYPDQAEAILKAPTRGIEGNTVIDNDLPTPGRAMTAMEPSDLIEVGTYYHAKSAAVPRGRVLRFLLCDATPLIGQGEQEIQPLEYEKIPIFRISAADVLGSPIGYGPATELAPMQEALDKVMSALATRFFAFGVPNIVGQRGASPDVTQMTGGSNFIEVDDPAGTGEPLRVLDLLQVKPEMFEFPKMLQAIMGTVSGINATVQGNPPPGVDAGVAIAQFQAMAVQFASSIQASYAECIEDLVLWIYEALRTHSASIPRVVQLAGKSKREAALEFFGADLNGIQRVACDMGNPLSRTAAGRAMIADYLRNSGIPVTPEQFVQVINTGSLEPASEGIVSEMDLIRAENEKLMQGEQVPVMRGENHALHIREHRVILSNPDVKFSPVAEIAEQHLDMHLNLWMGGDPVLGVAMGQIPMGAGAMPPPGAGPGGPSGPPHGPPPHGAPPPMQPHPEKGPGPGQLPKVMQPAAVPGEPLAH